MSDEELISDLNRVHDVLSQSAYAEERKLCAAIDEMLCRFAPPPPVSVSVRIAVAVDDRGWAHTMTCHKTLSDDDAVHGAREEAEGNIVAECIATIAVPPRVVAEVRGEVVCS